MARNSYHNHKSDAEIITLAHSNSVDNQRSINPKKYEYYLSLFEQILCINWQAHFLTLSKSSTLSKPPSNTSFVPSLAFSSMLVMYLKLKAMSRYVLYWYEALSVPYCFYTFSACFSTNFLQPDNHDILIHSTVNY